MAWGSKKEMVIAENAALTREVELLREHLDERKIELGELKQQLKYTQDALIAKESPEAYRDQKYIEEQVEQVELTEDQIELQKKQARRAEIASQYINEMESPLFKGADDMIQMLTRATSVPLAETQSLHGNDES